MPSERADLAVWAEEEGILFGLSEAALRFHEIEMTWLPRELALLSEISIPIERGLAQSLIQSREHEVAPITEIVGCRAVPCAANAFLEAGRRQITGAGGEPLPAAFSTVSDHQAYRDGTDFQYGFADVSDEEFSAAVNAVQNFVVNALATSELRLGRNLNVSSFPLGRDVGRQLPLREGHWIDQRLLELTLFWQMVRAQQAVALPAIDPNPGAFQRVFPATTTWPRDSVEAGLESPAELAESLMQDMRQETHTYVSGLKLDRREIDGLWHVNIEGVATGGDPYLENVICLGRLTPNKTGVVIDDWNRWITEKSPHVNYGGLTIRLGDIPHSGILPSQYSLEPVDDQETLQKKSAARRKLIQTLVSHGRTQRIDSLFTAAGIKEPAVGETRIVRALFGRAMTRKQLAGEVGCNPFTLHKNGWLPRLLEKQIVIYHPGVGGYYLRDFPPLEGI